jgi:cytochrome c-type biogenesis protein
MTQSIRTNPPAIELDAPAQTGTTAPESVASRLTIFAHATAFVLGFGLVFTLIGSAAGLLGQSLNAYLPIMRQFGAVLLVIFGLITIGVFSRLITFITQRTNLDTNPAAAGLVFVLVLFNQLLYSEKRVTGMHQISRNYGYLSSFLLGVSFSAGWVPCIGPILASIFFIAGNSATAGQGAALLGIYSLGLGIPFLITGAAFSSTTQVLRRFNRHVGIVSWIAGFFLFYVAYLLWSDSLAQLTTQFMFLNDWIFALEERVAATVGMDANIRHMSVISAAPLALLAGVISFLSPCVLPLVPAYIGYLSGTALRHRGPTDA